MISKILRMKSVAHYALAASLLAAVGCESATSPTSRAADESAEFAKTSTTSATAIGVSAPSIQAGQSATISATLYTRGHPLGGKKLTMSVDGGGGVTLVGTKLGTATWTVNGLTAGTHSIVVTFAGDQSYTASSGSATLTVNP
jgi:hypothetical protein